MKDQFIPSNLESILIQLGFNRENRITFIENGSIKEYKLYFESAYKTDKTNNIKWVGGILWQQAFDWFRDNHGLISWIYQSNINLYHYSILRNERYLSDFTVNENTYQEARLACLEKLIELVENKKG